MGETTFLQGVQGKREHIPAGSWDGRHDIPTGSRENKNTFPQAVGMDDTTYKLMWMDV